MSSEDPTTVLPAAGGAPEPGNREPANDRAPVVVVGAGLTGLACATALHDRGLDVLVLEAADDVGGRVRTDIVDRFLLDRGFQVLLTAYPDARRQLDYDALDLKPFYPGARVWSGGRLRRVANPLSRPLDSVEALGSGLVKPRDAVAVAKLLRRARQGTLEDVFRRPETTTEHLLREAGLSESVRERFFRPFLGGIMLDRVLGTSSRFFEFVLRMFAAGPTAIPNTGMGAIPNQLARRLPPEAIRTRAPVEQVEETRVTLAGGEQIPARAVVVATEAPRAAALVPEIAVPSSGAVACLYFDAPESPAPGGALVLDGELTGPVNNLAVLSDVAPNYAPAGRALVSASVLGKPDQDDERLEHDARTQLATWFGADAVGAWRHLNTYRIEHAQPSQRPPAFEPPERPLRQRARLWVCGDHRDNASINGALQSGRRAGEEVAAALRELAARGAGAGPAPAQRGATE